MTTLVTGAAGFIGFHVAKRLLADGHRVVGLDNLNSYYDPALKQARLDQLTAHTRFTFERLDVRDRVAMPEMFRRYGPVRVVHLAAQAGVRYSIDNPHAYVDANLVGFLNILEGCRHQKVEHLVFASSSSVYGANTAMPFSVHDNVDHPLSLYAATKKANELMAHSYAHLFGLPCTGLRFFTVYGPWGRPDMALFIFTRAILEGRPIDVFNGGPDAARLHLRRRHRRGHRAGAGRATSARSELVRRPVPIPGRAGRRTGSTTSATTGPSSCFDTSRCWKRAWGVKAKKNLLPLQPGDVPATQADIDDLARDFGYRPRTTVDEGLKRFVDWYRSYYKIR